MQPCLFGQQQVKVPTIFLNDSHSKNCTRCLKAWHGLFTFECFKKQMKLQKRSSVMTKKKMLSNQKPERI